jgi:hypothetical protein
VIEKKLTQDDLEAEISRLREALSLARSMILCGEQMSPQAEAMINDALHHNDGPEA